MKQNFVMKKSMGTNCILLGTIISILGIIVSFFVAVHFGVYELTGERDWGLTFFIMFCGVIISAVLSSVFFLASDVFSHMYKMEKQIYEMNNTISELQDAVLHDKRSWKCSKCGRENASYVGTCACGASKPC